MDRSVKEFQRNFCQVQNEECGVSRNGKHIGWWHPKVDRGGLKMTVTEFQHCFTKLNRQRITVITMPRGMPTDLAKGTVAGSWEPFTDRGDKEQLMDIKEEIMVSVGLKKDIREEPEKLCCVDCGADTEKWLIELGGELICNSCLKRKLGNFYKKQKPFFKFIRNRSVA